MKSIPVILLGIAGFIGYKLFNKAKAGGDLVFFPRGIRAIRFEGANPILELNLGIANTSNQEFTINAIAGNLYTNGTYVGYVSNFNHTAIHAQTEVSLVVSCRMSLLGIVSQLLDGLQNGTWEQDVQLELNANVDNISVPVKINYKLSA